jgi:hypothetical protein
MGIPIMVIHQRMPAATQRAELIRPPKIIHKIFNRIRMLVLLSVLNGCM